ncbi:unnamed protein product [Cyprideis torosa]|uniref:Uncharacterized protein n=1 Tax=Cyprideis torosa TaxID=163714 RepID=A0A7R8W6R6_9CRUS|nr:unnamed protein product [Cyprideis torosa]CAG0886777.1 unnamed protein product [Cyprideis torosa]
MASKVPSCLPSQHRACQLHSPCPIGKRRQCLTINRLDWGASKSESKELTLSKSPQQVLDVAETLANLTELTTKAVSKNSQVSLKASTLPPDNGSSSVAAEEESSSPEDNPEEEFVIPDKDRPPSILEDPLLTTTASSTQRPLPPRLLVVSSASVHSTESKGNFFIPVVPQRPYRYIRPSASIAQSFRVIAKASPVIKIGASSAVRLSVPSKSRGSENVLRHSAPGTSTCSIVRGIDPRKGSGKATKVVTISSAGPDRYKLHCVGTIPPKVSDVRMVVRKPGAEISLSPQSNNESDDVDEEVREIVRSRTGTEPLEVGCPRCSSDEDGNGVKEGSRGSPPGLNPLFPFLKAAATAAAASAVANSTTGTPTFPFSFMNMNYMNFSNDSESLSDDMKDLKQSGADFNKEDLKAILPYSPLVDCSTCPKCGKTFAHKLNIYRHVKSCGLPPQNSCELCDSETELPYLPYLVTAVLGKPPRVDRTVVCQQCKRTYASRQSLRLHQRLECGKPKTFKCPYCDLTAFQKGNVVKHIRLKHLGMEIKVDRINMDLLPGGNSKKNSSSSKTDSETSSTGDSPVKARSLSPVKPSPLLPILPKTTPSSTAASLGSRSSPPPLLPATLNLASNSISLTQFTSSSTTVTPVTCQGLTTSTRPPPMLIKILTPNQLQTAIKATEVEAQEPQPLSTRSNNDTESSAIIRQLKRPVRRSSRTSTTTSATTLASDDSDDKEENRATDNNSASKFEVADINS